MLADMIRSNTGMSGPSSGAKRHQYHNKQTKAEETKQRNNETARARRWSIGITKGGKPLGNGILLPRDKDRETGREKRTKYSKQAGAADVQKGTRG